MVLDHICEIHPAGSCPALLWGMGTTAPQSLSCFKTLKAKSTFWTSLLSKRDQQQQRVCGVVLQPQDYLCG